MANVNAAQIAPVADSIYPEKKVYFFIIKEIVIDGNRITKPQIIKRELDFKEGDSIEVSKIDALLKWERNKVFNTNLFVTVDVSLEQTDNFRVKNLKIVVKEQWYTIPQLILEPADRNLNEWIFQRGAALNRVNIGAKLFQYNVRGRRESLRLTLQTGFTNNFEISYEIPYIDRKQRWGIRPFFAYFDNKSLAIQTNINKLEFIKSPRESLLRSFFRTGISINFRQRIFSSHSLELSYNNNYIADTVALLNPDYFLNGDTRQIYLQAKYTYTIDKRDIRQYAHKGDYFSTTVEQLGFSYQESVQLSSLSATYAKYLQLGKRTFFATRFKAKTSFPNLQPYVNFKGLGYQNDLVRGYELYLVDGQHFLLSSNSARYRFFSKVLNFGKIIPIRQFRTMPVDLYFTVFSDYGIAFNDKPVRNYPLLTSDNRKLSNRLMGSIGAGIHIVTFYNSVLRFETSYNLENKFNFAFAIGTDI
ncbi:MAG: BamA/TamA family outer membrane protein [Cytophagales bacterium]